METETQLVADPIALNEKKVAMALDDLIKLSKRNTKGNKGRSSRRPKNKNRNFNGAARNGNPSKEKHYVNSLSGVRQGAVEKRRSNFKGNQFPIATNVACKAATVAPLRVRRRAFNAGRMASANQSRLLAPPVQSRSRFITKRHEMDQKVENGGGKWKTLDSRFAIMKEQRKNSSCNNGVGLHVPRLPPWARARRF
ncbi:uncharacterized protein LOC106375996 [Brassica napus]|uniref:uncharacterized protein LOC106311843 n=1 Tax=Brassica oleracea var. oleracea TaxID=109376 RepID=UPI0006A71360|nr:PREDICTED: uncharacterized protein LOC106311843 [Brassica oleracea var. oleracea]XP_013671486.2 uncharacterized protein LOC106375996 [Brassica napus]XP_048600075.1 uncharacterized protein LOC106375996 [Brassica napus]